MNSMYSKLMSKTVIYSKDNIEITEDLFEDGSITYTGTNNNKNALRTYIQHPELNTVKEYIINYQEVKPKTKKVIHVLESDLYYYDEDFEDEETKQDYYMTNDFWGESDFVSFHDNNNNEVSRDILICCIDNEIITINPSEAAYEPITNKEVIEMIERFYNEDFEKYFTALMVGNDYSFKDDTNYNSKLPKIWFRGNEGMYYYCWQYNQDVDRNI